MDTPPFGITCDKLEVQLINKSRGVRHEASLGVEIGPDGPSCRLGFSGFSDDFGLGLHAGAELNLK
jgi:hypothetical protein